MARKHRTSSPWRDLPAEPGPFQTTRERLIRWVVDGTWETSSSRPVQRSLRPAERTPGACVRRRERDG
ncbi:hypothetical protein [Streptomyces canarius]|uniref:hypothetical protein n=1 Tax=Streptomyces TaxID=1883 RepID=UPI003570D90A